MAEENNGIVTSTSSRGSVVSGIEETEDEDQE